jgi:hypothetical protein
MAEAQNTSVRVRVQARSGKFLGPAVEYALVSVWNGGQNLFGPTLARGDSGVVDPCTGDPLQLTASRSVIAVQPTAAGPRGGGYWLLPDEGTAGIVATFALAEPALLEFRAVAQHTSPNPVTSSVMMWVVPGMQLTANPGLVIEVPGLAVSIAEPKVNGGDVDVTATVTMMCGCPISAPQWPPAATEPYWPAPEFQVTAILTPMAPHGMSLLMPMTFADTNTFTATFTQPPVGDYTVAVQAVQPAETNVGYAQTTVSVPGS